MKMIKRRLLLLGLLLAMLVSCSSPLPPLRISIQSDWPSYGIAFIAQDQGLFAKYGVQVTLIPVPGYMESLKPYKEGQADAAFMVFADAIMFEAEGVSTRAVYITEYSETGDILVGQPTLNSLSDLKGKKIAFEGFNSFSHLFVLKLLEKAGVREGEFEGSNLDSSKVLEQLQSSNISAGHVYGPAVSEALAKGYKMLGKAGDIRHLMMGGLAVNAKVVNTRRKEVQSVIKALVEAADWLKSFPSEGFGIIAKYAGISKEELETSIKRLHVLALPENQEMLKKGGPLFEGGKEIIDFFYQKGVLVKIPDLNTVIDGQFIQTIGDKP